jgi:hypothetical protein
MKRKKIYPEMDFCDIGRGKVCLISTRTATLFWIAVLVSKLKLQLV